MALKVIYERCLKPAWSTLNDRRLNIQTIPHTRWNAPEKSVCSDARGYESCDYFYNYKLLRGCHLQPQDVVYDLGCGMGRLLCASATHRVLRCVGVELVPELCEIARQNAERMRFRKTRIEIRCDDCATTDLGDGTVYLLFNPFGARTLRAVLDNIAASLEKNMRPIRIAYSRPLEEAELASTKWLSKTSEFSTLFGNRVSIWSNQVQRTADGSDA